MTLSARNWAWGVDTFTTRDPFGEVTSQRSLKPGEKLTLLCIAESENAEYGYAFPSYEWIAKRTGQSVRTVQTHVKTLEQHHAFTIEKRRSPKGKWLRNVYVLNVPSSYRDIDPEWERNGH